MPEIENSGKTKKYKNENNENEKEMTILSALVWELRRELGHFL
jgi:hypothetical protein